MADIDEDVPTTWKEAMASPERQQWYDAGKREIDALVRMDCYRKVPVPTGRKELRTRRVLKIKVHPDGRKEYRARWCVVGCHQRPGIDYVETSSPVAATESLRAVIALAAKYGLLLNHGDFSNAYVQAELDKDISIYISQPEGFHDGTLRVLLLLRALYGLKQSGLAWYLHLIGVLTNLGWTQSRVDPCLFVRKDSIGIQIIVIYVDDLLVCATTHEEIEMIFMELNTCLKINDLGHVQKFLGI